MEIPQGYLASPICPRLFLKQKIDTGKVVVLFDGVPKPHFVSQIVSSVSHKFRLSSVQFRIHLYTHSWLQAIKEIKEELCSNEIYQNLKSIQIQVGRNCGETRYFNDTLVNNLEGLGILLVESTSRKSGTPNGMKLKFYYNHLENEYDESNLMNLLLRNLVENEIEYFNLDRRINAKLSPIEQIINYEWNRLVSNQLCERLVPIERLDHFCHNLEIDILSQSYFEMNKEEIIYKGIQAFFYGRDFQETKSEFDNILTSLGIELDLQTPTQQFSSSSSVSKKPRHSNNEYHLETGTLEALIFLSPDSPFLEKEALDFQKAIQNFGFHTTLIPHKSTIGVANLTPPGLGVSSCLLVSFFSTEVNPKYETEVVTAWNSTQLNGIPKIFLFNYYTDSNSHLNRIEIVQKIQRRETAVKAWNDPNKTLDLMDSIVCLSYSPIGQPNSQTFASKLMATMTESTGNDEDFTSTLFEVASRSSGFELKYFQFGLSKKLCLAT